MGMGRIPYFGVVHACGFDAATRRRAYLLVSDRGRFGACGRAERGSAALGSFAFHREFRWLNGRLGMRGDKGGCGRRS